MKHLTKQNGTLNTWPIGENEACPASFLQSSNAAALTWFQYQLDKNSNNKKIDRKSVV